VKKIEPDFLAILNQIAKHGVEFIVVGGIGAVLQGAPIATFDLDVVHSREPRNIDKLLAALAAMDATYRNPAARKIKPDHSHLSSSGHQLLISRYGPLDLLGVIGAGHDYVDLLPVSTEMEISKGQKVRVLTLSAIIKSKEEAGGEKDRAALPVLRRTLEENSKT
jgi:hypothetical protein